MLEYAKYKSRANTVLFLNGDSSPGTQGVDSYHFQPYSILFRSRPPLPRLAPLPFESAYASPWSRSTTLRIASFPPSGPREW